MKPLEHPHWLPWAPQIQVNWGPCRSLLSWVTLNRELLASSCKFLFIIIKKRINGQTLSICLEKRKTLKEKGVEGQGERSSFLPFSNVSRYSFGVWALHWNQPLHLIYPSCLLHSLMTTLKPQAHHSLHAQPRVQCFGEGRLASR